MANGGLHQCFCSDGKSVACICVRGQDHDETLFDVAVGDEGLADEVWVNDYDALDSADDEERPAEGKGITTTED